MTMPATCLRCGAPLAPEQPPARPCPACLLAAASVDSRHGSPNTAPLAPSPAELAPLFPQLEIREKLGQGGMGVVYRARQKELDREVALKLLLGAPSRDPGLAERFLREARALARLSHPNIVAVYDFGRTGEHLWLLLEFVEGENLRQAQTRGKLAPERALALVGEVCSALQYAHDQGVVHRDIKPENLLVDRAGHVKIADFGLAKLLSAAQDGARLTRDSQAMGTPQYMAPEQIERPLAVDHRADIYSLGVVFYELLTGELPLGRFAPPSRKVVIDVRLDGIVLKALEKEPEQRYQRAGQVRTEVENVVSTPAAPASVETPVAAPARRQRSALFWIAVLAGVLLALFLPLACLATLFLGTRARTAATSQHDRAIEMQMNAELQRRQAQAAAQPTAAPEKADPK
jgi:predicted Ser/Thr protein kinase